VIVVAIAVKALPRMATTEVLEAVLEIANSVTPAIAVAPTRTTRKPTVARLFWTWLQNSSCRLVPLLPPPPLPSPRNGGWSGGAGVVGAGLVVEATAGVVGAAVVVTAGVVM